MWTRSQQRKKDALALQSHIDQDALADEFAKVSIDAATAGDSIKVPQSSQKADHAVEVVTDETQSQGNEPSAGAGPTTHGPTVTEHEPSLSEVDVVDDALGAEAGGPRAAKIAGSDTEDDGDSPAPAPRSKCGSVGKESDTATADCPVKPRQCLQSLLAMQEQGYRIHEGHVVIYVNGSSTNDGTSDACAGTGIFYGTSGLAKLNNKSLRLPGLDHTHQTSMEAELYGMIAALEHDPVPGYPLEVRAVSGYTLKVARWLESSSANGRRGSSGRGLKDLEMLDHLASLIKERGQPVRLAWTPTGDLGHWKSGIAHAQILAEAGRELQEVPMTPE